MSNSWRPTATIDDLKTRAELIQKIRHFFLKRDIWEVETPCLSQAASTDIHLHSFETQFHGPGFSKGLPLYLMTSPEFHMKRLLAAGSGPIFQISKAFRNEEAGRYHNPEFTMLEWYRPDFDHHDLMEEVGDLLHEVLSCSTPDKISYQDAFRQYLNICPLDADIDTLRKVAHQYDLDDIAASEDNKDTLLQLLFNLGVESQIGKEKPCFVYDFPASQAALAKVSTKDPRVASRFEVYFHGIELANGFHELDDPSEQQRRFEADNAQRLSLQLPSRPIDHHLINAISYGLPSCAGVAIGIDRLLMLALSKDHLHQVQAFSIERA